MLPATHLEPGVVVAKCAPTPGILDVGRIPGGTDDDHGRGRRPTCARRASSPMERADILAWKRRKLLLNVGNGVDASFRPDDAADELAERAVAEGERVLARQRRHARLRRGGHGRDAGCDPQRRTDLPPQGGSTWQSLQRGTGDSEVDYLAGEIVLQGRLHGRADPGQRGDRRGHPRPDVASGGEPRSLDARDRPRRSLATR